MRTFSFEFFPPKDEIAAVDFGINIGRLLRLSPSFVTVTYGAGGSSCERTFALVDYLHNKVGLKTMAHYTCVESSKEKIKTDLATLRAMDIDRLMLLRGDPQQGADRFHAPLDGFAHASELIAFARSLYGKDIVIGGGAYPEKHPEAESAEEDLLCLKKKVDAGCDFLITQFFFDNNRYFDFVAKARAAGIACPIIPGILPITHYNQLARFVRISGANIPQAFLHDLEAHKTDSRKIAQIGSDFAIAQCRDLLMSGAPGIHFYTLNKSRATVEIFESLLGA
ncbi:MAG: methylenetetrahydrofolate reductase [NAD(P)H] [Bacteroidales bacterium]|nr:methylenetetrahydrofolate reductase [NAD(P)H] [Bacteroidales bacterium]MCL2738881.1 methylenetetrahydrofolate reductase [NAD(P)H] [Bacteroidales bacterium]